jgi:hypothetical protein
MPIPRIEGFSFRVTWVLIRELSQKIGLNGAMSVKYRTKSASRALLAALPIALVGASASAEMAASEKHVDPMRFFEGKTEGTSTIKVIMRKPYQSRTSGSGEISDGVLSLVQRVNEDGKAPYDRHWRMRQVGPGRFTGTMTEAIGPVTVQEVAGRYRFHFKMKGNLSIEQWLTPLPGGRSARSKVNIRKFGMKVGSSEGTIRKL